MTAILAASGAVVGAWSVLLGAAAACRRMGLGRARSAAIVLACYAGLAAAAVLILGRGWQGIAGAGGMLLPCAVAVALVALL